MEYDYRRASEELQKLMTMRNKGHPGRLDSFPRGEMMVLNLLYKHGGDVLPSEIGERMGISSARIASILNGLEGKNLITRRISPTDRRKILVELTDEGRAKAVSHHEEMLATVEETLRGLGEDDTEDLLRILRKLFDIFQE